MSEFMLVAMDQVINEAPRLRYMSGGQVAVPLVLKAGYGFAAGWAGQHSNCIYHTMMGIPGCGCRPGIHCSPAHIRWAAATPPPC
jgi:pyruvate dehydrogenase E1 component beta subunit